MKVLLTVGYNQILLPNDQNLAAILKALSAGVEVHDLGYKETRTLTFSKHVDVKAEMLPPGIKLEMPKKEKPAKALALPEPSSILL